MTSGPASRRGPRTGEDTRGAILDAARTEFARAGYEAASLRGIARVAGVDPALVHHYFDGKDDLFARAVAQVTLHESPQAVVARVLDGPPSEVGVRAVTAFLSVWDDQRETFAALVRSLVQNEEIAAGVRGFLGKEIFGRVAREVDPDAPADEVVLRGGLVAAQMLGLATARYVVQLPGVAEAGQGELVARIGPVVQHYLLPGADRPHGIP